MAVPNMIVTLVANTTKYASGLRKAAGQTKSFGDIANIGFNMARKGVVAMGVALAGAIPKLANMGAESRKADIQLRFMLENMQGISSATDQTVKRMAKYAQQVSKATGLDDEAIKAVQKKILVFQSLRTTADELGGTFDRTTKASIDLAAAGFGDAETNAVKLGRVLEDPIKNMNALNRAGITFTATEKAKIKALVDSGKLLKAQELILGSIEKRVGGLAEASATPFEKMMQQFNEMGDTIGEAMLPNLEEMNLMISQWLATDKGKKDLKDITDGFVAAAGGVKEFANFLRDAKNLLDEISKFNAWWTQAINPLTYAKMLGYDPVTPGAGNKSAPGGAPRGAKAPVVVNVNGITPTAVVGRTVLDAVKNAQRLGMR